MKKRLKILFFIIIASLIFASCAGQREKNPSINDQENIQEQVDTTPMIKVFASFYPYYDFAKKIGGDKADVQLIVPPGAEPHSFELAPRQIVQLQEADIFIYNGLGVEPWADKALHLIEDRSVLIVEGSRGIELLKLNGIHHENGDHDDHDDYGHDHFEGEYDPHVWLDPIKTIQIAENIMKTYIEADPDNKNYYEENFEKFKERLEKLHEDFEEGLKNIRERKILVSHSAFGYLAHRYDIEELNVAGLSPHEEPSPARLAQLTKEAKKYNIKYIFFEALATPKTAEILAQEADLDILILYNMEGMTEELIEGEEDYISLMYANLENLRKALVR
jgi:zinc transport system substrate-binding protein